jgi:hypothetical protein
MIISKLFKQTSMRNQTLSATPVAQQFQENTSTATSVLFLQSCISCIITPLNWKQAAKPLHRHSLSIIKSYGEKGILFSMIKHQMQKKLCKTNDRHFSKIPLAFGNEILNGD